MGPTEGEGMRATMLLASESVVLFAIVVCAIMFTCVTGEQAGFDIVLYDASCNSTQDTLKFSHK